MKKQVSFLSGAWAHVAVAGRPLAVDDADPVDPGRFEFETGAAYEPDNGHKHWDLPFGLAYGLVPGVEVGVGFGCQFEKRTELLAENGAEECVREHGIGDLGVGAKWQFMPSCPLGARHALVPSVKFPTADEDKGFGIGLYNTGFRWNPGESLTVDLAGGSKITGDAPDFVATMGLTCTFGSTARPSERN